MYIMAQTRKIKSGGKKNTHHNKRGKSEKRRVSGKKNTRHKKMGKKSRHHNQGGGDGAVTGTILPDGRTETERPRWTSTSLDRDRPPGTAIVGSQQFDSY